MCSFVLASTRGQIASPHWNKDAMWTSTVKDNTLLYLSLQKLVNETFQKMWFTPTPSHHKEALARKTRVITDVVNIRGPYHPLWDKEPYPNV